MIRALINALVTICVIVAAVAGTFLALRSIFSLPLRPDDDTPIVFQINEQESFHKVAEELEEQRLIRHAWSFNIIAQIEGKDKLIKAGEYELAASMTPEEILEKFVSGKMLLRRITIKEGQSIWEIGTLLEQAGISSKVAFQAAIADPTLLKEARISGPSFEGYLFPETYQFPKGTPIKTIIFTMLGEFNKRWPSEFDTRRSELGLTKHQVITLASIIEKESGTTEEQPNIASVFYNRLKKKMRLQADPTVIYAIPSFNGNLTKVDLEAPTAYNTYVIEGLPPGPIGNPGLSAIRAALFPADTEYLYFVADNQGHHVFSETLEEHNKAVNLFQKGGR